MSTTAQGAHDVPNLAAVKAARQRLSGVIQTTPVDLSQTFSEMCGNPVYLKMENLQTTGSFKLRGAYNKIALLSEEQRRKGVIAASAGNHAQGVAYAARVHQVPCTIVMPEAASLAKVAATRRYGAEVVLAGASYDEAYVRACELQSLRGATFVHAFDDPAVIAGQGTLALEVLEQVPTAKAIVVPVGGGGLAAGIAMAAKAVRPDIRVFGVESASVPAFRQSMDTGQRTKVHVQPTIADGIAVAEPGRITYELVKRWLDDVFTVEEEQIARSMVLLLERSKIVAEGAAAAAVAAVAYGKVPRGIGDVVVIVSGGNVDVTMLSRIIEHGLVESGRFLRLSVTLPDRPGALRDLLDVFASLGANVLTIQHHRVGTRIALGQTEVEIDLETRDAGHIEAILQSLKAHGYLPNQLS
ncbi:MAG: threonine ammonia-lyase [Alicyclobacillus macrosporangiidus]|uniref:threonine ammonia-lyase n=1 Tax=Alicyclobacillus TaxID=29330 RepID=UPI0003FBDDA9|nr:MULTISPECIES: threonine ammonia-lyase [Alicyclobacillus]MCL6597856.1 threonine ammonia-lyase [Alicyclobacillus macrosporangiidus]